ncbi:MAG TPA: alkaline phosphatase D family protein [Nevskiaceae bacterium]|nr:alkaline phosphatase D family protein [Nevskiaceae bacterium]
MSRGVDLTRRRLLVSGAGFGALHLVGCASMAPAAPAGVTADPFTLGVASGEPWADGFVLWTRLVPTPVTDESGAGGMPPDPVEVGWIVAEDEHLAKVVQQGVAVAQPEWGHSVHVEVQGLQPDRAYWYAFRLGSWRSPIGGARTAPVSGAPMDAFRFAFASCQNYETGYYAAWRDVVDADPHLVIFLGDYLYEKSRPPTQRLRAHASPDPVSLAEYRRRYEQYRLDDHLQRAHAHCCWLVTWDDHEVRNDYADLENPEEWPPEAFAVRRAAAYQAWYEHMPVRLRARPVDGHVQLYASYDFGDLLRVNVLDGRQYRDHHPCTAPGKRGGRVIENCEERLASSRTLLGTAQEDWLAGRLTGSPAVWNVLAQQYLLAPLDQKPGPGEAFWSDNWDGAPAARHRLLRTLSDRNVGNPVVIGGDIHSYWANDVLLNGIGSPVVASEFTGTSISSPGISYEGIRAMRADNPHVKFADSRYRGHVLCEVTKGRWRTQFRALDDVMRRDSASHTLAAFVVESGLPGVQPG